MAESGDSHSQGGTVVLTVDGKKVTRWTTETNVSDFLAKAGLVDSNDNLSVSRSSGISRQGLSINVDTAQDVIVKTGITFGVIVVGAVTGAFLMLHDGSSPEDSPSSSARLSSEEAGERS